MKKIWGIWWGNDETVYSRVRFIGALIRAVAELPDGGHSSGSERQAQPVSARAEDRRWQARPFRSLGGRGSNVLLRFGGGSQARRRRPATLGAGPAAAARG